MRVVQQIYCKFFLPVLLFFIFILPLKSLAEDFRELEPGFSLARFTLDIKTPYPAVVTVLRIDPARAEFILLNSSDSEGSYSLGGWADKENLVAAINASMYLPDNKTSTGYMRSREHENNGRIVTNFGAFFVAGPHSNTLPYATLLDREKDPWQEMLAKYNIVIQNYRLIDAHGRVLWLSGGPAHAAAVIAADRQGNILFIHCREPLSGAEFGQALLTLPLNLRMAMYVEGGSQAGLLVRAGDVNQVWMGRHAADIFTLGNRDGVLPNVLGVKRR